MKLFSQRAKMKETLLTTYKLLPGKASKTREAQNWQEKGKNRLAERKIIFSGRAGEPLGPLSSGKGSFFPYKLIHETGTKQQHGFVGVLRIPYPVTILKLSLFMPKG
jgi:hypothetical protein